MIEHKCAQMSITAHKWSLMLINCVRAMNRAILLLALGVAFAVSPARAITLDFDGAEYTATTAENIKVAWDASRGTINGVDQVCTDCEYEVRVYHVERKSHVDMGKTKELLHGVKLPRTGHYVFEVRACRNEPAGSDPARICSDWASSINKENSPKVGDQAKKWRVYGRPAPTGGIVIEK